MRTSMKYSVYINYCINTAAVYNKHNINKRERVMIKLPTLLPKDSTNPKLVIPGEVTVPVTHFAIKLDGTSVMIKNNVLYARYDAKLKKRTRSRETVFTPEQVAATLPPGAIECQPPDTITGHWPHWVPVNPTDPQYGHIQQAYNTQPVWSDGTYECIGPKVQSNPHREPAMRLIPHTHPFLIVSLDQQWKSNPYEYFKEFLKDWPWEGLVAYNSSTPVAKIRRGDFGYPRVEYNPVSSVGI